MGKDQRIEQEVEKTLQAFDADEVLEENPFLFTRLQAERATRSRVRKERYVFGVNLKYAAVVLLVLLNLVTAIFYERHDQPTLQDELVSELKADFEIDQAQNNF